MADFHSYCSLFSLNVSKFKLQKSIPLKCVLSDPTLKMVQKYAVNDDEFLGALANEIEANKNKADKDTFWPTTQYVVKLIKRYNMTKKGSANTMYTKKKLMASMAPALFFHYTMRRIFKVPGKQGLLLNGDESMNYRWDPSTNTWSG